MSFHVGQKVVCVDDSGPADGDPRKAPGSYWVPNFIKRGALYTVRTVEISQYDGRPYIRLHEIVNPVRLYLGGLKEIRFAADRFRPLIERKTDISVFTEMLTPKIKHREVERT